MVPECHAGHHRTFGLALLRPEIDDRTAPVLVPSTMGTRPVPDTIPDVGRQRRDHDLVADAGGQLVIESAPGQGTRAEIILPVT